MIVSNSLNNFGRDSLRGHYFHVSQSLAFFLEKYLGDDKKVQQKDARHQGMKKGYLQFMMLKPAKTSD